MEGVLFANLSSTCELEHFNGTASMSLVANNAVMVGSASFCVRVCHCLMPLCVCVGGCASTALDFGRMKPPAVVVIEQFRVVST